MVSWTEVGFAPAQDDSEPAPEEAERVGRILAEADDPNYWWAASKDGNREAHYRGAPLPIRDKYPWTLSRSPGKCRPATYHRLGVSEAHSRGSLCL